MSTGLATKRRMQAGLMGCIEEKIALRMWRFRERRERRDSPVDLLSLHLE
jgi:hypothetical protein